MKITLTNKKQLEETLKIVKNNTVKYKTPEVLFFVKENKLHIISNGLGKLKTSIDFQNFEGDKDDYFSIKYEDFTEILNILDSDAIIVLEKKPLKKDNYYLSIIEGDNEKDNRIPIITREKDEIIIPADEDIIAKIKQEELKKLLEDTKNSLSDKPTRYALHCFCFEIKQGNLFASSTDTRILARSHKKLQNNFEGEKKFFLEKSQVLFLLGLLKDNERIVTVHEVGDFIYFSFADHILKFLKTDGEFPIVENLIPERHNFTLTFEIRQILKVLEQFSKSKKYIKVILTFDTEKKLAFFDGGEDGSLKVFKKIPFIKYDLLAPNQKVDTYSIGISVKMTSKLLKTMKGDTCTFKFVNESSPVIVNSDTDKEVLFIFMPCKIGI